MATRWPGVDPELLEVEFDTNFERTLEEIDMRSVDDIEFRQSLLERIFGIGEIVVVSTDKVAPRRTLHGIHNPRNTRELIRGAAYQVTQRQLFTRST